MATTTNDGSGYSAVSGTWASQSNAYDGSSTTYALGGTAVATHAIDITGYDFATPVPSDATLNSVVVNVSQYVGNASRWNNPTVQAYDGTTAIGSPITLTERTTAGNEDVTITGITLAQVRSANFKIRFSAQQTSTTGTTKVNLGWCNVTVDYTPAVTQVNRDLVAKWNVATKVGQSLVAKWNVLKVVGSGAADAATERELFDTGSHGDAVGTTYGILDDGAGTGAITLSNEAAVTGSLSAKALCDSGETITRNIQWDAADVTLAHVSAYVYLAETGNPDVTWQFIRAIKSPGTTAAGVVVTTGGNLRIRDGNTAVGADTYAMPRNQWVRIEWKLDFANDLQYLRVWTGATLHSAAEGDCSFTTSGSLAAQTGAFQLAFGHVTALTASTWTTYYDAVGYRLSDWAGPVGGGTITLTPVWNVRAKVGQSASFLWNVLSGAGLTQVGQNLAALWNVRAKVGQSVIARWNVRAAVAQTLITRWNVRATVARTATALWNVRAKVGQSLAALWRVRSTVGQSSITRWNVRAAVGNSDVLLWNVRQAVGQSDVLRWNVRQAVGQSVVARWNVRAGVARSLAAVYNVRAKVGQSVIARWNVRAAVGQVVTAQWNVLVTGLSAVGRNLATLWNVRAAVGQSDTLLWNVRQVLGWGGTNILTTGQQDGSSGWTWANAASGGYNTTTPITGGSSVTATGSGSGDGLRINLSSRFTPTPGRSYAGRVTVRNDSAFAVSVTVYLEFFSTWAYISSQHAGSGPSVKTLGAGQQATFYTAGTAAAPATMAHLLVITNGASTATLTVDDAYVWEMPGPIVKWQVLQKVGGSGTALLSGTDSTFDVSLGIWGARGTGVTATRSTSNPLYGAAYAQVTTTTVSQTDWGLAPTSQTALPVVGGATYRFSARVQSNASGTTALNAYWRDSGGVALNGVVTFNSISADKGWQFLSGTLVAPANAAYITPVVYHSANNNTFKVDLVQLEQVKESPTYLWSVRALVGQTATARWNVRALAASTMQSVWDVRATVTRTTTARWNVLRSVANTLTARWPVRAAIGQQVSLVWDVLRSALPWLRFGGDGGATATRTADTGATSRDEPGTAITSRDESGTSTTNRFGG